MNWRLGSDQNIYDQGNRLVLVAPHYPDTKSTSRLAVKAPLMRILLKRCLREGELEGELAEEIESLLAYVESEK